MYKLILCWRYLQTRYIALASVISVTLGVATLIVVNSMMSGFTHEMQYRIHGILSDLVFDGHGLEGFSDSRWHMERIRKIVGDDIQAMTPTVHVPAMLNYRVGQRWVHRQVNFIGIDFEDAGKELSVTFPSRWSNQAPDMHRFVLAMRPRNNPTF